MSETRQIFVESVEENKGWLIVHSGDVKYGTKEKGIRAFIGKTATFNVGSKKNGQYTNWYINAPLPEVPAENTPTSAPAKEKTMILAYAKDFAVAYAPSLTKDQGLELVAQAYNKMCEIIGMDEEAPF